jgi:hypothetical protein
MIEIGPNLTSVLMGVIVAFAVAFVVYTLMKETR